MKVSVKVDFPDIESLLNDESFGLFAAQEWHRLISQYTPHRNGDLENSVAYEPFAITYNAGFPDYSYAHYMYMGEIYVDPVYKVGGFTTDGITWWSRPGIKKEPSGRRFNYRTDPNPFATDHWDKKAAEAGQADKLAKALTEYLKKKI